MLNMATADQCEAGHEECCDQRAIVAVDPATLMSVPAAAPTMIAVAQRSVRVDKPGRSG